MPETSPGARSALTIPALFLVAVVAPWLLAGCGSRAPDRRLHPHEAARARVQFLRQHGPELDQEQVRQIRRMPHTGSERQLNRRMTGVLQGEELRDRRIDFDSLGQRRSVLGRARDDVYRPEPPPPGHWAPGYEKERPRSGNALEPARPDHDQEDEGSSDPREEESP